MKRQHLACPSCDRFAGHACIQRTHGTDWSIALCTQTYLMTLATIRRLGLADSEVAVCYVGLRVQSCMGAMPDCIHSAPECQFLPSLIPASL